MMTNINPGCFFEIPVLDLNRAMAFYNHVFGYDFTQETIHGNQMAFLPYHAQGDGIGGALVQGEAYIPSQQGTLIYLRAHDLQQTLAKVEDNGGAILFPVTAAADYGLVAEIADSEGNRIGLFQPRAMSEA
jgi:predicted enzyme related to lactoylglutathione lyase